MKKLWKNFVVTTYGVLALGIGCANIVNGVVIMYDRFRRENGTPAPEVTETNENAD